MSANTVYVIRHGETDFNRDGRLQGHMPVPLNQNGQIQAEALGLYLKQHEIDVIYSSPLLRARQTADIISQVTQAAVCDDPRFGEIAFGDFEGLTHSEIEAKFGDEYRMWRTGDMSYTVPNGESRRSVQKRMTDGWAEMIEQSSHKRIAIVSHGSAIRILLRYMFHYLPTKTIENTSLTTISRFERVWEIESFAERPHLTT